MTSKEKLRKERLRNEIAQIWIDADDAMKKHPDRVYQILYNTRSYTMYLEDLEKKGLYNGHVQRDNK